MIEGGLKYGYVCTGEAFIFLRVLHDGPSTAYYYLSVPKERSLYSIFPADRRICKFRL